MRSETVKHIVKYYGGIPEDIKLLKRERDALEDEYNGLGGLAMDGMPHSSAPGNPTEALAVRVIENGVKNRLQEIGVQVAVLEGDAANIRGALDAVNGKYKSVMNPIRHSLLHDKKHCRLLPAACRKPPKLFRYGTGRKYRQAGARSSKCQLVSDKST